MSENTIQLLNNARMCREFLGNNGFGLTDRRLEERLSFFKPVYDFFDELHNLGLFVKGPGATPIRVTAGHGFAKELPISRRTYYKLVIDLHTVLHVQMTLYEDIARRGDFRQLAYAVRVTDNDTDIFTNISYDIQTVKELALEWLVAYEPVFPPEAPPPVIIPPENQTIPERNARAIMLTNNLNEEK